jgi:glycosyltransferase involved in cell wall biosynthesis
VHLDEDPWSYFRFSDVDCDEPRIDKALAVIRTYSHALVVASPLNRTFVPEAEYVPKAIDVDAYGFVGARRDTRPLIVHAPSKRATKGTEFVVRGIEELRGRGIPFDFRVIERVPHDELRTIYEDADVVVDNVLLGDCEVSSLEAMTLGKVVVTRIREEVRTAHPDLPVVSADPNTLVDALLPLLSDAALRRRLGEESRAYVERNHAAHVVAQKLVPLYELAAGPVWRVFPEWTGLATDRKLEAHEKRIQDLQVQIARLRRQLSDENSTLQDLRALYGSSRPIKFVREMRRYRARRG